mmetsp:Transcript_13958/g.34499  ORF Transcript_13958/g.34499 Transcript_13958/m.34499 type:complete len:238 (-) Transcript_13958:343-1056(-)
MSLVLFHCRFASLAFCFSSFSFPSNCFRSSLNCFFSSLIASSCCFTLVSSIVWKCFRSFSAAKCAVFRSFSADAARFFRSASSVWCRVFTSASKFCRTICVSFVRSSITRLLSARFFSNCFFSSRSLFSSSSSLSLRAFCSSAKRPRQLSTSERTDSSFFSVSVCARVWARKASCALFSSTSHFFSWFSRPDFADLVSSRLACSSFTCCRRETIFSSSSSCQSSAPADSRLDMFVQK